MAGAVAAIRFLFDIVVWRPLDGGRTLARAYQHGEEASHTRHRRRTRHRPSAFCLGRHAHRPHRMGVAAVLGRGHSHRSADLRLHRRLYRDPGHGGSARGPAELRAPASKPHFEIPRGADIPVRAGVSRGPPDRRGAAAVSDRRSAAALRGRYRDADPHLHHARLGTERRGRARGTARSRLRRLLRRRRLHLCADLDPFRLVVLGLPAARRLLRGALGHDARLPGPAPSRRLPRHRDAGVRRNCPHHPHQLAGHHRRPERRQPHPAPNLLRPALRAHGRRTPSMAFSASSTTPRTGSSSSITSSWCWRCSRIS